jgi:alanine racemase
VTRPTRVHVNAQALIHNLQCVRSRAPNRKIISMVKANAYGCGLSAILHVLEGQVDAFGVACIEEAMAVRELGSRTACVLFQGIFRAEELKYVSQYGFDLVVHHEEQLKWILETPLKNKIKVWVKVDTGMHRLGFQPEDVARVIVSLKGCPWVMGELGLMTHLACADEPLNPMNQRQLEAFNGIHLPGFNLTRSIANSAAILSLPEAHADVVRPGLMLYGVSPFVNHSGRELGLMPVLRLVSEVSAIHQLSVGARVGYGGTWQASRPSTIAVVPVGYGDGYPRHIKPNTPTFLNGVIAPIVGRVSMDMLSIDITDCPNVQIGDAVELWGQHIPVETIAEQAGTIGYELICQTSQRVRFDF